MTHDPHPEHWGRNIDSWNLERASEKLAEVEGMVKVLATAIKAADLYLNSYDTSAPSRIKAETRLAVEEAMALLRPQS